MAKVFISHKKEDSDKAKMVAFQLNKHGINYYLDLLDDEIFGSGDMLTNHLKAKLSECSHLTAVITNNTRFSWWVPFEIGLATEKDFPISTVVSYTRREQLPDYLWKWPVLETPSDLEQYCLLLRKEKMVLLNEEINKSYSNRPKSYSEAFHRRMKMITGQIR